MKLRISPRHLPNHTDPNWPPTSHTLHRRHNLSLLLHRPHMPRRTIRLTNPQPPCKRSLILLYLHLLPHRPRALLWLIPIQRNLKHRHHPPTYPYSNCFRRLCSTMRTNILLRGHCYHQLILSHPLLDNPTLTRFFALHFLLPFIITGLTLIHLTFLHESGSNNPLGIVANSDKIPFHPYYSTKDILGGPRKLYPSKPTSHTPSHQTRVILPICIRHPTLNPQQTRGRSSPSSIRTSPIPNPTPPQIQAAHNNLPSPLPTPILSPSGQPRHPNMIEHPFIIIGQLASLTYFTILLILFPSIGALENKILNY
eukprot:maker-scaffold2235_size18398-snap-gene-0.5 protein:Tk05070 transcript:maker-scaffold2235_size18398-snap-gene-0.5-mRNA-1 annotation:"cytochrome b"